MAITGKDIRENWMILTALVGLAGAWGVTQWRIAAAETETKNVKTEVVEVKKEIVEIRIQAEGVRVAAEAQQKSTEKQLDLIIQAIERMRADQAAANRGR